MQSKVYLWVEWYQSGRTSIVDDCSGCPITSRMAYNVEQINAMVQEENSQQVGPVPDLHTWTRCICGFVQNRKRSSQMASGSSQTLVTNMWTSEGIMSKNDSTFVLV
jgi:hypothetical protein